MIYMKEKLKLVESMKNKFNKIIHFKKNEDNVKERSNVSKKEEKFILNETYKILSDNLYYYNYETISFAIKLIENDINNGKDDNFVTIAIDAMHGSGKTFVANFIYFIYNITYLLYNPVIKYELFNILDTLKETEENELNDEINKTIIKLEKIRDSKLKQDNKLEEIDKSIIIEDVNEIISKFNDFKEIEINQSKKQKLNQFIDTKAKKFKKPKRDGVESINNDFKKLLSKLESVERIEYFYENKGHRLCIYISIDEQDYDDSLGTVLNIIYNSVAMQFKNGILEFDVNYKELMQIINDGLFKIAKGVLEDSGNMVAVSKAVDLIGNLKEYTDTPYEKVNEEIEKFNKNLKKFKEILIKNEAFFIVDNLDKCNPGFLVSFIDKIKYLFIDTNIPFVFMIDNEYFKNLSEGKYGTNTNLSYYYNNIFYSIHKMYLKPKDKFIEEMLIVDEKLELYKNFYNKHKTYIEKIHDYYQMSLHEIEILINRFNMFLEDNWFITKNIENKDTKFIPYCVYNLLGLQIIDIHSFNSILYNREKILDGKSINIDEKDVVLKKTIVCEDEHMKEFINKFRRNIFSLTTLFVVDDIGFMSSDIKEFTYKKTNDGKRLIIYNNGTELEKVSIDKFCLSYLFNYDDLKSGVDALLNMTVTDYLRFKISQV